MKSGLPWLSEFPDALEFPDDRKDNSYQEDYPTVNRCFAFIDIKGFTPYTQTHGTHAAARLLVEFRHAVRTAVGRRGVRVAKWLGDGVMLVSERTAPVVAVAAELMYVYERKALELHCGIARGPVVIFDGDDFIGRHVNIAAKLMDEANGREILAYNIPAEDLPVWVIGLPAGRQVSLRGIGPVDNVRLLQIRS